MEKLSKVELAQNYYHVLPRVSSGMDAEGYTAGTKLRYDGISQNWRNSRLKCPEVLEHLPLEYFEKDTSHLMVIHELANELASSQNGHSEEVLKLCKLVIAGKQQEFANLSMETSQECLRSVS